MEKSKEHEDLNSWYVSYKIECHLKCLDEIEYA